MIILYPNNFDWIIAGDVFTISKRENNVELVCIDDALKYKTMPLINATRENIYVFGHGKTGYYGNMTAAHFAQALVDMGLQANFSGEIEFFTCSAGLSENGFSLVESTKNRFPYATVIGAKGASIIENENIRLVVNSQYEDEAAQIQKRLTNEFILTIGEAVRNNDKVKEFYNLFVRKLNGNHYILPDQTATVRM